MSLPAFGRSIAGVKVLYVACNPPGLKDLMLGSEITELQLRFANARGELVQFIVCPQLPVEALGQRIADLRPDVLHISAHGDGEILEMGNSDDDSVPVTASTLASYLDIPQPPRLVYLNACNSDALAKAIVPAVPMAIGASVPITNRSARAAAVLFYDRILLGSSVRNAFVATNETLKALQSPPASAVLYHAPGVDPDNEHLYEVPRIVAQFVDDDFRPNKNGFFTIQMGVAGCPADTIQVVFYTDDESFLGPNVDTDDESDLAGALCRVVRTVAVRHAIWSASQRLVMGDFRTFLSGVTAAGRMFQADSTLCAALSAHYERRDLSPGSRTMLAKALVTLRANDGSED